jgi:hypothetical protein
MIIRDRDDQSRFLDDGDENGLLGGNSQLAPMIRQSNSCGHPELAPYEVLGDNKF